jgi:hypothetical protein
MPDDADPTDAVHNHRTVEDDADVDEDRSTGTPGPDDSTSTKDGSSTGHPLVTIEPGGHRLVSWTITDPTGKTLVFQHDLPDGNRHHYRPSEIGEDVLLYEGPFRCQGDDGDPFDGFVRWRWTDKPRIEARGTRPTTVDALQQLLDSSSKTDLWVAPEELVIDLPDGSLPSQPDCAKVRDNIGQLIDPRIEQQLGDESDLHRVTFLVPNGWEALDGPLICDADELLRQWNGRVTATGGGWSVTIDPTGNTDWRALKDSGSFCFTHIGELTRADGSSFTGGEAFHALDRVRVALNLALGRRTTCALPVGWREDKAVWTRWRSAPVDPYRTIRHWVDDAIATRQVTTIVQTVLDFTADPAAWDALRPAVAYYVAANNDVDVELSVSVPVSALQLLAYYHFVSDRRTFSNSRWNDLNTEAQVRLLLDEMGVDLTVQPHFQHLSGVQTRLAQNVPTRDALGLVVKMRNVVTHPSKNKPAGFSPYEWAEAGMHARYWLCLALLYLVGYCDEVFAVMGPHPPWTGERRLPPWMPPTTPSP